MARWRPDPTFYASPRDAVRAPAEELAYVALLDPTGRGPDAMGVVDLNPRSTSYGSLVGRTDMPNAGDELHHFGWNACSSCLCPTRPTRTSSAAISWSRACARRASTSSTPSPTPAAARSSR